MNLLQELELSSSAVRQRHLDKLRALGIPISFLADVGREYAPFGVSRAEPAGAGLYQPGEGFPHLILPVVEDGVLVDLCAVRTDDPTNWKLRVGNGWALGLQNSLNQWTWYSPASEDRDGTVRHEVGKPTHLYSDPLDWLMGAGEGICILDWSAAEVRQLDVLSEVVCSDRETALLLEQALRRPVRLPNIKIMEVAQHAA